MRIQIISISLAFFFLAGCEKNTGYVDPTMDAEGARVKFIHSSWNGPSVNFYGRDTTFKFSAVAPTTANVVQGIAYGAVYPSFDYALLPVYDDSLRIRVPSNSATVPNYYAGVSRLNVQADRNYSVFLVDSFPTVNVLLLNDTLRNFSSIPDSTYDSRFVHTLFGVGAVDVYSQKNKAIIFNNIPYKGFSKFTNLKVYPTNDTLEVRLAGTTTRVGPILSFAPGSKKTYTWFTRGRFGSTTAAPTLGFYTNQ